MHKPIPTHLISGLLGSGKTTCLRHLIGQKPKSEKWLIIINEFGEIDIDTAQLSSSNENNQQIELSSVAGGCICCSAQLGLTKALNTILQRQDFDRLFIEPTGLGHPAKIIDTLTQTAFPKKLELQPIICLISPQQLTPQRWQKSQVMRDLVTLADLIVLNKTDLSSAEETNQALEILHNTYPVKDKLIQTCYAKVLLDEITFTKKTDNLTILSKKEDDLLNRDPHQQLAENPQQPYESKLPQCQHCFVSHNKNGQLLSAGWIWHSSGQFNRVKLKQFFEQLSPYLLRAKGLLKTGNEWQLINWSAQQLDFDDIAWRQDSRLELFFIQRKDGSTISMKELEQKFSLCINK